MVSSKEKIAEHEKSVMASKVIGRARQKHILNTGSPNKRIEELVVQYLDELTEESSRDFSECKQEIIRSVLDRMDEYTGGQQMTLIEATTDVSVADFTT